MANFFSSIGNGASFTDSNGAPLSGALLFTYVAGSTTKKTTHKDEAGAASHTNPIVLDSNGRPTSPIWLIGGTSYKFVLAPSNDTDPPTSSIYTWDDLDGINDTSVTIDQWVDGPTPTFVDTDTFTLVGDQTTDFHVNRRVKLTTSAGTVHGYISVSAFTTLTTIDVVLDSGALDAGLSAVSLALLTSNNQSYPNEIVTTDTAQTITALKTVEVTDTGNTLILRSTDAGAVTAPRFVLDRNSASPAANDQLARVTFTGRNSVGNPADYATIQGAIITATSASEDGEIQLRTFVAGSETIRARVRAGLQLGAPTGADKGAGTLNAASTIYQNNVPVVTETGTQTLTNKTIGLVGATASLKPLVKDHGTKAGNYTLQIDEAELHMVDFSALATLTIASANTNDKATVVVKNGGNVITLAGIDNDSPTLTNAITTQDFIGLVKSFGKITAVAVLLNKATV